MPATVRLATADDVEAAARTLSLAHRDYVWAVWAFPRADRLELLYELYRLDLELGVAAGSTWVTDECDAVAIWASIDRPAIDPELIRRVHAAQAELIGDDAARLAAADAITHRHRPTEPYWYLGTVGTLPARRGQGLATEVLRPVLERCDTERSMACLETSSDANVRLYTRLGFEVVHRATSDDGALPLIVMTRDPR